MYFRDTLCIIYIMNRLFDISKRNDNNVYIEERKKINDIHRNSWRAGISGHTYEQTKRKKNISTAKVSTLYAHILHILYDKGMQNLKIL